MKQYLSLQAKKAAGVTVSLLPYLKRKRILLGCGIAGILLTIAAILSFSGSRSNAFLSYDQNIEVLSYQGGLQVAIDDRVLSPVIQAEKCQKFASSIDGTIGVFLTSNKELYLVQKHNVKKIADDVLHFESSSTGMGIAFAQKYAEHYSLTLWNVAEGTRKEITALLSRLDFSLSPDGESVAYYTKKDDAEILMCHRKGEDWEISHDNTDLVGLSNGGKYIFAVCSKVSGTNALYAFNRNGKATELGAVTSISFKFSADHQQIMFYNNGKTLVSTNGQAAGQVSSYPLYLVTAPNSHSASDGNSITLPVDTLFDHIYTCSDGESTSAWLIRKDPKKSQRLVSRVSSCTLDSSAEYLYFIYDFSTLSVMEITNSNFRSYSLAENVDNYAVSSNRRKVFYTSNGTLYCSSGKKSGHPKVISTEIVPYSLVMSASNTAYYLTGSTLYTCKNGRNSVPALENIQNIYASPNNVVYIIGSDEIYTAFHEKLPVKVLPTT